MFKDEKWNWYKTINNTLIGSYSFADFIFMCLNIFSIGKYNIAFFFLINKLLQLFLIFFFVRLKYALLHQVKGHETHRSIQLSIQ